MEIHAQNVRIGGWNKTQNIGGVDKYPFNNLRHAHSYVGYLYIYQFCIRVTAFELRDGFIRTGLMYDTARSSEGDDEK